jgi:hypothetical protein
MPVIQEITYMTETKKTCPIMSRPAPQIFCGASSSHTNFDNVYNYPQHMQKAHYLMKVQCLESECQLWIDACNDSDCDKCMMRPETEEERNNCLGKEGRCSLGG